jgi:hypothetical protein
VYLYTVDAMTRVQKYRIRYIPLLLIFGLASVIAAAGVVGVVGSMVFYTRRMQSAQAMRQVDGLRAVVDCVSGLQECSEEMGEASQLEQKELERWARKVSVRDETVVDDDRVSIHLTRAHS